MILCQRWSEFYDLETRFQTSVSFIRGSCQYDYIGSHVGLGKTQYLLYAGLFMESWDRFPACQLGKTGKMPIPLSAIVNNPDYAANRSDFDTVSKTARKKPLAWTAKKPDIPTRWKRKIDLLARGMVLCDAVLFVAGPPDLLGVATRDHPHSYTPVSAESLRKQHEAWAGQSSTILSAISTSEGEKLAEYKLAGLPTWDGLIAVHGRLYLTMQDGTVRCFSSEDGI